MSDEKQLTLQEAREAKAQLEAEIRVAVNTFIKLTGLDVERVNLLPIQTMSDRLPVYAAVVEVRL
jgi:outer membrane protein TolC